MLAQDVSEEDFGNIVRHAAGGVISDGFSLAPEGTLGEGKHHPRSYGAFPYFLRRFVREQEWLSCALSVINEGFSAAGNPGRVVCFGRDRAAIEVADSGEGQVLLASGVCQRFDDVRVIILQPMLVVAANSFAVTVGELRVPLVGDAAELTLQVL